jgi:hypothetical protein
MGRDYRQLKYPYNSAARVDTGWTLARSRPAIGNIALVLDWRPQRDSNSCYRRERAVLTYLGVSRRFVTTLIHKDFVPGCMAPFQVIFSYSFRTECYRHVSQDSHGHGTRRPGAT